jgi:hypothetical protein
MSWIIYITKEKKLYYLQTKDGKVFKWNTKISKAKRFKNHEKASAYVAKHLKTKNVALKAIV